MKPNSIPWKLHGLKWRVYWSTVSKIVWVSRHLFGGCWNCGSLWKVQEESSRTAYHVTGIEGRENTPVDPNRCVRLCRPCAEEHHQHWDSMWSDYYSGLL